MIKMVAYPAVFHKDESCGYWVEFPDLPGCLTEGDTLEEAKEMAADALKIYYSITNKVKEPSIHEKVMREFPGEVVLMVCCEK